MSTTTTAEPPEIAAAPDGPLLDLTDAAVKKFIKQAKARGYVTMDELNKVLPSEEVTSEAIEDTLAMLSEMGVNVVEAEEERARGRRGGRPRRDRRRRGPTSRAPSTAPTIRCACTCAKWARSSCSSREGEIAIAKRIEAGRDTMIRGLCESALTFEAIMVWREELGQGRILLREVIDLEQTYGGQVAQALSDAAVAGEALEAETPAASDGRRRRRPRRRGRATTTISTTAPARRSAPWKASCAKASWPRSTPSPGEFEVVPPPAGKAGRAPSEAASDLTEADRKAYDAATIAIVNHLKTLKLNNNRIEALVEQLYAINKRLMGLEGRLLRVADSYGISRNEFVKALLWL